MRLTERGRITANNTLRNITSQAEAASEMLTVNFFSIASKGKFTGNGPLLCTENHALAERANLPWCDALV